MWPPSGHKLFKEWKRIELEPNGHLYNQNAYMDSKRLGWKPGGQ